MLAGRGKGTDGVSAEAEIEDKTPLTQQDKQQMFVDILPIFGEDDGEAYISFYLEEEEDKDYKEFKERHNKNNNYESNSVCFSGKKFGEYIFLSFFFS